MGLVLPPFDRVPFLGSTLIGGASGDWFFTLGNVQLEPGEVVSRLGPGD